uniref:Uncharacterized protein n=1 Tax=Rhizophora mucronata TaxID=61149 RepID=A0A2P2QDQ8_RHIMU
MPRLNHVSKREIFLCFPPPFQKGKTMTATGIGEEIEMG